MSRQLIECVYILIGILLYSALMGWMQARDHRILNQHQPKTIAKKL